MRSTRWPSWASCRRRRPKAVWDWWATEARDRRRRDRRDRGGDEARRHRLPDLGRRAGRARGALPAPGHDQLRRARHLPRGAARRRPPTSCSPISTRCSRCSKRRAFEHKLTPTIGRSHGIHAEPVTFGLKLAQAYAEFARNRARLVAARAEIATCAISGAVGTFANVDPRVEAHVAEKMGLRVEPVSTQVIPRDRHAMFFATLGVIASSIERLATEIRHLQRTEVLEAEEYFAPGQKGSSAMPHKRNPVLTENLTGLARMVRAAVDAGAGECRAVARARHLATRSVERYHRPRRDDHARFRARPADRRDRQAARLSRADAEESRPDGRPRPFAARAARAHPGRRQPRGRLPPRPAQRDEGLGIGRRAVAARAAQGRRRR